MILAVGFKIGSYPTLWRDRKPNIQQFMRSLHPNCEMCGKDSSGGSLDVHHLKWDKKHDCTYENLFVVCRGCHVRLHRRGDGWFPSKPWEAAWGDVPDGLVDRNHLDKDGNAIAPQIMDNNKKSKLNESEHKSMAKKKGLYENINAKRDRIENGSGEKMREKGDKGAPTEQNFKDAAKTAKKPKKK